MCIRDSIWRAKEQNKENVFTQLPPDWRDELCFTYFPFRAIYSDSQSDTPDNRVNNWLVYRALSLFDFPQNYGDLTSLDGIQDKAVLARFENKALLYNKLLTIDTSNPQAAYIGNPRLFSSSPPIDFAETDLGYAWFEPWLSWAQVNVIALWAIPT